MFVFVFDLLFQC